MTAETELFLNNGSPNHRPETCFKKFIMIGTILSLLCLVSTFVMTLFIEINANDISCENDKYFCDCMIYEYDYKGIRSEQNQYFDLLESYEKASKIEANGVLSCGKSFWYGIMYPIYVSRIIHPDYHGEVRYALVAQDSIEYHDFHRGYDYCARKGINSGVLFKNANNTDPVVVNSDSCSELWNRSYEWKDIVRLDPRTTKFTTIERDYSESATKCTYMDFPSHMQIRNECNAVYAEKTKDSKYWLCAMFSSFFLFLVFISFFLCMIL